MHPICIAPQGAPTNLARQLPPTGRTCDNQDEARTGHYCSDELPDRGGHGEQLLRLQTRPCGRRDPGDHDALVQRLWHGVRVDAHT